MPERCSQPCKDGPHEDSNWLVFYSNTVAVGKRLQIYSNDETAISGPAYDRLDTRYSDLRIPQQRSASFIGSGGGRQSMNRRSYCNLGSMSRTPRVTEASPQSQLLIPGNFDPFTCCMDTH